jgi:hypothetical protein
LLAGDGLEAGGVLVCGAAFVFGAGRAGAVALGVFSLVLGVVGERSEAISSQPPMAMRAATSRSGI